MFRCAAAFALLSLGACTAAPSQAQQAQKGSVTGRVVDEQGKPVAGAEIFANYQSFGGGRAMQYGASHQRGTKTAANGTYRIQVADMAPGEYSVSGYARIQVGDRQYQVDLIVDDEANFASTAATVRNFRLGYAEGKNGSDYGVGGIVLIQNAVMDYTPLDQVEVTLAPSKGGAPLTRRLRQTGEGWVATGVPFDDYRVSVRYQGSPLLVRDGGSGPWLDSVVGTFKPLGATSYEMRVDVRQP